MDQKLVSDIKSAIEYNQRLTGYSNSTGRSYAISYDESNISESENIAKMIDSANEFTVENLLQNLEN